MIQADTTMSFLQDDKKDPAMSIKLIAELMLKEPFFASWVSMVVGGLDVCKNPVTAALLAVSAYEKMRLSQEASDQLKKDTR